MVAEFANYSKSHPDYTPAKSNFNSFNPISSNIFYIIIYTIFAALKNSLKITSSWELNILNTNNLA